ncbi:MAG: LuxR C-terminal-related transcriptional regulator [Treponema sp.]|jgi:DNA-binding NarL/FixJ family response regulator|nr:LuxR C-terminal-related transcriptional regulator [Treponema sp.]
MNNGIGIATGSPFLADMVRNLLPADSRAVSVYTGELELLAGLEKPGPRMVFMENSFDGLGTEDFIYWLTRRNRALRVAVWTVGFVMPAAAARFVAAGADSFMSLRDTGERELRERIGGILSGRPFYPAGVAEVLEDENFPEYRGNVTGREAEIIRHSVKGGSIREIAGLLGIEPATVKTHKNHVYKKCGGNRYGALLRYALSRGIISLDELGEGNHDREE